MRQMHWLERDMEGIESFLDEFDPPANGEERMVETNTTGDLLIVRNMPLPDQYAPDYVDILLMTDRYPDAPPIGIYLLERNNAEVIAQLRRKFNVMARAYHNAPTVEGYQWVCFAYLNNCWRFNSRNISAGDNLRKFLVNFYHQCS